VNQQVKEFFTRYEEANSSPNALAIGIFYAETFMFAGPNGAQTVRRDDFLRVIPRMKAYYASIGLSESKLHSIDSRPLDARYLLASVVWRIASSGNSHIDASSTYTLLCGDDDEFSIVFQIDHQDLASLIKRPQ
jgi:hypothetical protein